MNGNWFLIIQAHRKQLLTHSLERGVLVEILDRLLLFVGAWDLSHSRVRLCYQSRCLSQVVHLGAV